MLVYDMLRIERRVWRRGSIWVSIEDILYWSFAAIGTFHLFYRQDNGVIRWFAIAATFFMMLLMNRLISRWTVPLISRILQVPVRFLERLMNRLIGWIRKIVKIWIKQLKSSRKKVTIKRQKKQEERKKKRDVQRQQQDEQRKKRGKRRKKREKHQEQK